MTCLAFDNIDIDSAATHNTCLHAFHIYPQMPATLCTGHHRSIQGNTQHSGKAILAFIVMIMRAFTFYFRMLPCSISGVLKGRGRLPPVFPVCPSQHQYGSAPENRWRELLGSAEQRMLI
jgi:hypothetical protein